MSLLFLVEAVKALAIITSIAIFATIVITVALLIGRQGRVRSVNGGCLVMPALFLFAAAVSWLAIFVLVTRRFRRRTLTLMDVIDEAAG